MCAMLHTLLRERVYVMTDTYWYNGNLLALDILRQLISFCSILLRPVFIRLAKFFVL